MKRLPIKTTTAVERQVSRHTSSATALVGALLHFAVVHSAKGWRLHWFSTGADLTRMTTRVLLFCDKLPWRRSCCDLQRCTPYSSILQGCSAPSVGVRQVRCGTELLVNPAGYFSC